jgi:TatD DNase family protein
MIDSHCHLTDPRLLSQLDDVLRRARDANVTRIITIGTNPTDAAQAIELCRGRESVRCAIGVHPNYCHEVDEADLPRIRQMQDDPSVVALGEMGLDYHYNFADRARQRRFFEWQLNLAVELKRPVVIHCREAADDTLAILRNFSTVPAVFHCFTGTVDEGMRVLEQGYLLGFTGVVTFKNSAELRELVKRTPRDRMLVETDAPYLSPEPMRKQRVNEPSFVMHTAAAIARVLEVAVEEVDRFTTENVARFFPWHARPAHAQGG